MVNYRSFLSFPSSYRCITFVKMMMIRQFLLVPPTTLCLRRKNIIVKCAFVKLNLKIAELSNHKSDQFFKK